MSFRATAGWTEQWPHFDFDVTDGVATITLNRPDKLNALTLDVYADLRDLLAEIEHRDDVAVVVITGRGKGFCSGGDVDDIIGSLLQRGDNREVLEFTRMTGAVVQRLRELPRPVIAAVNGTAAGAGAVIALASDFRLLSASASFRFLFTKVGLAGADMGCAYLLPRLVGLGRATEILMLGDRVDAEQAERIGLATRVVSDDALTGEVAALARRLADGPTFAYAATKSLLTKELDMSLPAAIELEAWVQAMLMRSGDHAEFYRAFTEGRDPKLDRPVSAHRFINPPELLPASGFSHIALPAAGQTVYLAGQTAHARDGSLHGTSVGEQAYAALANLRTALRAAGAQPEHLVAIQIYVTDVAAYRAQIDSIGRSWQTHLGKHFPAVSLFGVAELFDPKAMIEIVATAVIPEDA